MPAFHCPSRHPPTLLPACAGIHKHVCEKGDRTQQLVAQAREAPSRLSTSAIIEIDALLDFSNLEDLQQWLSAHQSS